MNEINPFKVGDVVRLTDEGYKHLTGYSVGQAPNREDIGFIKKENLRSDGLPHTLAYLAAFFSGASNGGSEGWNVMARDIELVEDQDV